MSVEDDTDLRDLIVDSLEKKGILAKIKAELRASVFLALEETENEKYKIPISNEAVQKIQDTKNGRTALSLVRDFLQFFHLDYTLAVLDAEISPFTAVIKKNDLEKDLNLTSNSSEPLLMSLLEDRSTSNSLQVHSNVFAARNLDWKNEINLVQTNSNNNNNDMFLLNDMLNVNAGGNDPFFDEPLSAGKEPFSFSFSHGDQQKSTSNKSATLSHERNENSEIQAPPKTLVGATVSGDATSEDDVLSDLLQKRLGKSTLFAAEPVAHNSGCSLSSLRDLPSLTAKQKDESTTKWLDHFDILHAAAFNCVQDDYEDDFQSSESGKSGSKRDAKKNGSNSKENTDGSLEEEIEEDLSVAADDLLNTSVSLGEENDVTSDRTISHLSGAGGFDYMEKLS